MLTAKSRRLLLPRDTRERHAIVAELARGARTLLDVGGVAGELQCFLPSTKVITANVEEPAEVIFDGSTLPFEDRSFDAVTSLDVLEHLPRAARLGHVAELARVARSLVIVACPLGTEQHVEAECQLADWYAGITGSEHRFLREHLEYGLPTEAELLALAMAFEARGAAIFRLTFSGDFRKANATFMRSVRARHRKDMRSLARYALDHLNAVDTRALEAESNPFTNRAFLVGRIHRVGLAD